MKVERPLSFLSPLLVMLALGSGAAWAATPTQQNILVDPAGGSLTGYRTVQRLVDVPFGDLGPGSNVLVRGGTYSDPIFITSQGASGSVVTVVAEPGTTPVLTNSVAFDNAAYVTVSGLTIQGAQNAAFIIRQASSHVVIANSTVINSSLGILISDQAGTGHQLIANTLDGSRTFGIAIDAINAPSSDPTFILANTVTNSGIHGMEINGSGYIIESNRVNNNGLSSIGTSGIHIYAKSESQDAGDRNVVRYNIVANQKESTGQDGNGIQVDQWCDNNFVAFNVVYNNDGAGLLIFDGANNYLINNTSYGNSVDSGGRHVYRGEIILANDIDRNADRTANNTVLNNIVVPTRTPVAAIVVEATATDNNNSFGPNMLYHTSGGRLYRWGTVETDSGASLPLNAAAPDLVELPAFADPSSPFNNGFALTQAPSRNGIAYGATQDIVGRAYASGEAPTFGAYRAP